MSSWKLDDDDEGCVRQENVKKINTDLKSQQSKVLLVWTVKMFEELSDDENESWSATGRVQSSRESLPLQFLRILEGAQKILECRKK